MTIRWILASCLLATLIAQGCSDIKVDPPPSGDEIPLELPTCESYCDAVTEACSDEASQYKNKGTCLKACTAMTVGSVDDPTGNTLVCRMATLNSAQKNDEAACNTAGPTGGDVCGSYCDNYCALTATFCTEDNVLFDSLEACLNTCATFFSDGVVGKDTGDTVQCRIYHSIGAAVASPPLHCGHADSESTEFCVPATGDSCADPHVVKELPYTRQGDTSGARDYHTFAPDNCASPTDADGSGSTEDVYMYSADAAMVLVVKVLDAAFDARVWVVDGCKSNSKCLDWKGPTNNAEISVTLEAGQTVYIFVEGDAASIESNGTYVLQLEPSCTPQCENKACGNDGCGGSCGECDGMASVCASNGQCVECETPEHCGPGDVCVETSCCSPICSIQGLQCGDNGCGGTCGTCEGDTSVCSKDGKCVSCETNEQCVAQGDVCVDNECCTPLCATAECGDNGCGGTCGNCPEAAPICASGQCVICEINNQCVGGKVCVANSCCTPICDAQGKECGEDACGGSCGSCPGAAPVCSTAGKCVICETDDDCSDGACVDSTCCTPICGSQNKECGDNGCGGTCGACPGTAPICSSAAKCVICETNNQCAADDVCVDTACCTPICTDLNKECGQDGCSGSCGTCPGAAPVCSTAGQCIICKIDAHCAEDELCKDSVCEKKCTSNCAALGKDCGDDGCAGTCGTCGGAQICLGSGKCVPIPPLGENCLNPILIQALAPNQSVTLPSNAYQSSSGFSDDYSYTKASCPGNYYLTGPSSYPPNYGIGEKDLAYAFTPSITGEYTVSVLSQSSKNWTVYVVMDCDAIGDTCVQAADASAISGSEEMTLTFTKDTTYYIIVDGASGWGGVAGYYNLAVKSLIECTGNDASQCGDNNQCTMDTCLNGACQHAPQGGNGCCAKDFDCGKSTLCNQSKCINFQCVSKKIYNCCQNSQACTQASNFCYSSNCSAATCDYKNSNLPFINCCLPDLYKAQFESPILEWTLTNTDEDCGWQVDSNLPGGKSGSALYYGSANTKNYDCNQSSGIALSPYVNLPQDTSQYSLKMDIYADIEISDEYDIFEVYLEVKNGSKTLLYTKLNAGEMSWKTLSSALSSYGGKAVRVRVEFDTVDGVNNDTEGVYIDNVTFDGGCKKGPSFPPP